MDHFGACIQVLVLSGEGDAGEFTVGISPFQYGGGIQVGNVGTKGSRDPFHDRVVLYQGTLGIEVVHVFGPVLNGGIAQAGAPADVELHTAGVEVGHVVFGGGAAFDKMQVRAFIHNDQGVLELAGAFGVEPEIGLQGNLDLYAGRHIYEGTAGPDGPVQCREFVVIWRDQLHEVVPDHLRMGACQGAFQVAVDDALLRDFIFDIVIDQLGIVLGADAGQRGPLRLGDAQLFKGILNIIRNVFPGLFHVRIGPDIGRYVVHIQAVDGSAPAGNRDPVIDVQAFQPELPHPFGIMLLFRNLFDDLRGKAGLDSVKIIFLIAEVINTSVDLIDLLVCHSFLPYVLPLPILSGYYSFNISRPISMYFSKPSRWISSIREPSPSATIRPRTSTWVWSTCSALRMAALWVMISRAPPVLFWYSRIPAETVRTASTSSPESVSSRMASLGLSISSCRISAFFFSPPEKPAFRSRSA